MRAYLAVAIAGALMFAGCERKTTSISETITPDGQKSQAPPGVDVARADRALVRFINADPRGKARELWLLDNRVFPNVAYKEVTPYVEVPTKVLQFRVRESDGSQDLVQAREEMFAGRHYTLVAIPMKDGTTILQRTSDKLNPPKPGMAEVRVINATVGVDNLDLYHTGSKKKIKKDVDSDVASGFAQVDAGTFEIRPNKQAALPQLRGLHVEPNRFYTFLVVGKAGSVDVVPIEDNPTPDSPSNPPLSSNIFTISTLNTPGEKRSTR